MDRCAKREDRYSPRETPWLQSWIGFPVDPEPVDYLILDGRTAVVGFFDGGFDYFAGRFYRDGDVVHHTGECRRVRSCILGIVSYNVQLFAVEADDCLSVSVPALMIVVLAPGVVADDGRLGTGVVTPVGGALDYSNTGLGFRHGLMVYPAG